MLKVLMYPLTFDVFLVLEYRKTYHTLQAFHFYPLITATATTFLLSEVLCTKAVLKISGRGPVLRKFAVVSSRLKLKLKVRIFRK